MNRIEPEAVAEQFSADGVPLWCHPDWSERFPWLRQGITGTGPTEEPFDLGLAGSQPVGKVLARWGRLGEHLGFDSIIHSLQVHTTSIRYHGDRPPPGLSVLEGYDGHITRQHNVLLTISVADCVPVFLVGEESRTIALIHSGWRGTAAGILEDAVGQMKRLGTATDDLWMHCGPAICGRCYEVGPEVHAAVNPRGGAPDGPMPIDLRGALALRGRDLGISSERITVSAHCTRCGPGDFFSHRAGSSGRQMGVLGLRPPSLPEA